jgi:hypothetical protein
MLISHTHRFIFIHVGKTGGMSMREALLPYCAEPEKFKIRRPPRMSGDRPNPMYTVWETLLLHAKARDVQKEIPAATFHTYYKFGFVRNPWDLQVSLYHFILREPEAARHDQVKACGSFEAFVEWAAATPDPYPRGITKLQGDMLTNSRGQLLVDFVGRYETLDQDFALVAKTIGIAAALPRLNRSDHRDYRTYYNGYTRQIVAETFRADIELFGYTFDRQRLTAGLGAVR